VEVAGVWKTTKCRYFKGNSKWVSKFRLGAFKEVRPDLFAIDILMANSISAKVARIIVPRLQIFHSPRHHPFA
jgi:hypothetical protein